MVLRWLLPLMGISLLALGCTPSTELDTELDVVSPRHEGIALGDDVLLVLDGSCARDIDVVVDGLSVTPTWQSTSYPDRSVATLSLATRGDHTLELSGDCNGEPLERTIDFRNDLTSSIDVGDLAAGELLSLNDPADLNWNWEPATMLFPLARFAASSTSSAEYLAYVRAYHDRFVLEGLPVIDHSDVCSPALSAYHFSRAYADDFALPDALTVLSYIEMADRNAVGALDHWGTSFLQMAFPDAIWLDSLFMYAIFAAQYGLDTGDDVLADFALSQPGIFASGMTDPVSGLMFHSFDTAQMEVLVHEPWLRGNGWYMAAIAEMLSEIDASHPRHGELATLLQDISAAMLTYREPTGYWDTVVSDPGYGYEESSGSALVAFAFAKGARLGVLAPSYREAAKETFRALTSRMEQTADGYAVTEISGPTTAISGEYYRTVDTGNEYLYGYGAFLLLAEELGDEVF